MNKKRTVSVFGVMIAVIGIVVGMIIFRGFSEDKDENDLKFFEKNDITRYEWVKMLCEQEGLTSYKNDMPYFADVDESNSYFQYLQSAVEWEVLDASSDFDGEDFASGRFVALTAMKAIGQSRLRIFLDTEDRITDDIYMQQAIKHGLMEEEQLTEGLSAEECERVLEVLKDIRFGEFWRDDYSKITYQSGVVELIPEDILQCNTDCSEIVIAGDASNTLETGMIIVFEEKNTKLKIAREITGISSDKTLLLKPVELDEVVESLTVSDITEVTFENIVNYYASRESAEGVNGLAYRQTGGNISSAALFSANVNSKGYKLSLSTAGEAEDRYLEVKFTDNATGVSVALPVSVKVESGNEYSAEIDIDKICIGAQVSYSLWNGSLEYAEAAVDAHATLRGTVKADKEIKILLCKTPVPLGNGIVGADIQIYLVLSAEGSISFEAELPIELSTSYEKDKGFRNIKHDISPENPTIEANCEMGVMLRLEPTLVILGCLNIIDVEADMGVTASATVTTRSDSQVCADISVSFPVITLSVCGDDEADTLIGNLGLSAEWEIIAPEDAPVRFGLHYELLPDKTTQFVENCTYKESMGTTDRSTMPDGKDSLEMKNTYITRMTEAEGMAVPVFMFDYPDNWTISEGPYIDSNTEYLELTNENGTLIRYSYIASSFAYGNPRLELEVEISKVADSSFVPGYAKETDYSELGKFAVVKINSSGLYYYSVKPESECGACTIMGNFLTGFWYDGALLFSAIEVKELSTEEEQEMIAILSSFRVADGETLITEEEAETSEEDSILTALQEGDFSYFAGTYRACGIYSDWYGEELADLTLREDGVVLGGGMSWYPQPYPETEPISVTKNEDGAYLCQVEDAGIDSYKFLIYPEGVIGDNPYIYNDPFLTKTVYIQYIHLDGGVMDTIYYKVEEE